MSARETAERHGQDVATGNMRGAAADFTREALKEFTTVIVPAGDGPPEGTNQASVLSQRREGDQEIFEIEYSNGRESRRLRSAWSQVGDAWKITKLEPVK